jgi:hypothetical protein
MQEVGQLKVDRIARLLLAACLIGGPLAGIVVRAAVPSSSTASVARSVVDYGRHSGATQILLIGDAFLFLLVPAALAATALAWRRAPVLSLIGGILSLVGWTAIVMLAAQDALISEAGRQIYEPGQASALATSWSSEGLVNVYIVAFIAGHVLGTAVLGLALWRSRAIPRLAAAFVGLSMPLHLVTVLTGFKAGDVGAWVLLLIGFAACARQVLQAGSEPSPRSERRLTAPATA